MNTVEVLNALNAGEETTAEPADTPEVLVQAAEPALVQPAEPALVQPAEVPQDQVTDSVSHSEEKMQKLAVSNFQLQERVRELEELLCEAQKSSMAKLEEKHQMEKANLTNQVAKLRETVQKMGNMLTETHRECEALTDYERKWEAHIVLQKENDEMKETLMPKEELLTVSLAEAEEKPQKAEETIAQLEVEKANLTNQVKTLRGTVQNLGNMLTETHRECDELTDEYDCEWEAHIILRSVNNEMKETLMHKEELLKKLQMKKDKMKKRLTHITEFMKRSLAKVEEKHQNAMETIAQLEVEKAILKHQVETLQRTVQSMGNMLAETHRECDELTNEYEREQEANSILEAVNDEMKETLMRSLAKVEEKHQNAMETIVQLVVEQTNLKHQVETLQSTVQSMGNMLAESHRECDALTNVYERKREAHIVLQKENDEMKETLMHKEELLTVSLAEAEEKPQKAEETIAQLEVEKANLTNQVKTLRGTVQNLGNMLTETHRECDELTDEYDCEWEAHIILRSVNNEMKETLMHKEELLKKLQMKKDKMKKRLTHITEFMKRSLAKVEEKHQNAMETIVQLVVEKADLKHQVETLQSTVQNMRNMLAETHRECDELTNEFEREHEANSIFEAVNDEMKETLMCSLVEVEEKHQNAMETIVQLVVEQAILKHQVKTLQRTVQNMGNMLAESHRECDALTNEYEREQEANSILEAVNDEMKETLMCSLVEVEEKHQNAMETISQLEVEKADLKHQVETLQSTVQSMENMLAGTHRECDELTNDYEREQEANSILEAVNDEMKETVMELEMKNNEMMETLMEKEELLKTPWQKLRSNTSRLFKRRRQKTTS
ncbi:paramyosin-like isoform X2 [Ictalurus furcatus]|uniref:paramyosin-like isoform X2 n=1 Tax=Ictalurus furcatus TaxID=66913 RepID=UPI0023503EA1|nr:paramyosin-like isoform X2 [Ictalurus furcatus]